MLRFPSLSVLLFAICANAQIQTPPSNVSTGFVRLRNSDGGVSAFSSAPTAQQVSWFYTDNGLVVYDGDIVFGTIAEFEAALVNVTYNSDSNTTATTNGTVERRHVEDRSRRGLVDRSNSLFPGSSGLWPDGNIKYRYFDDESESQLAQYVDPAIKAWEDAVPCLKFSRLPNSNDTSGSEGIVNIVANNPSQNACFASLGYGPYPLWMSLDTGGACGRAENIHEWGRQRSSSFSPFLDANGTNRSHTGLDA